MIEIRNEDLHNHLKQRMAQRGVSLEEIERTLNDGWAAKDAKVGTLGKVMVFEFSALWENKFYQQKEVPVYYNPN